MADALPDKEKKFTRAELAAADGAPGKPACVAYAGRVYDVSGSDLWAGGEHMGLHQAGADLTEVLSEAPHGPEMLERVPQVGVLLAAPLSAAATAARPGGPGGALGRLLHRFPLLKRHPHPMLVHFPIVFFLAAPAFSLLHLATGNRSFEETAFHCLCGGVLFTPPAILTGLFTWWLNYQARFLMPVRRKLVLAPVLLALAAAALIWRLVDPEVLSRRGSLALLYLGLLLTLVPLVTLVGWYGATITFPLHEEEA
jgi:predicted heme/steroid binding protein/uncharacterized membrane protein